MRRAELKDKAKIALKETYWMSVLFAFIMGIISGNSGASFSFGDGGLSSIMSELDDPEAVAGFLAIWAVIMGIAFIIMLVAMAFKYFLFNVLHIGCLKYFNVVSEGYTGEINNIGEGFKGYGNVVLTMFLKDLYVSLWSLLFIIPGIIKTYEYMLIPYILADNPKIDRKEAFHMSKEMMRGHKFEAFVLGLSFFGWMLLSMCTCMILYIFYVSPYIQLTFDEFYQRLKKEYRYE